MQSKGIVMEEIYQKYAQTVYKYLLSKTQNADLAEELTQETFYQAVRSIERFVALCDCEESAVSLLSKASGGGRYRYAAGTFRRECRDRNPEC